MHCEGPDVKQKYMLWPHIQANYYISLALESGAKSLPPVFTKVHNDSSQKFIHNLTHYRNDRYRIIDDDSFISNWVMRSWYFEVLARNTENLKNMLFNNSYLDKKNQVEIIKLYFISFLIVFFHKNVGQAFSDVRFKQAFIGYKKNLCDSWIYILVILDMSTFGS